MTITEKTQRRRTKKQEILVPPTDIDSEVLIIQIRDLCAELGKGKVDGVAYDTAWTARLAGRYPGFDGAVEWLRRHQYEDGSWGAPLIQYHDRFISTLAGIVALREVGKGKRDERRIKRGEDALWKLVGKLGRDDSDTIGFPIISASLAEEATVLGLEVPMPPVRFSDPYKRKVKALLNQPERNWRFSSITFSLEALRSALHKEDQVLEANASVGVSPSATAAYLLAYPNEPSLEYLRQLMLNDAQGAVPAVAPIDMFEITWSINHLRKTGLIKPDDPEVRRALDLVWKAWSPERGLSYSAEASATELDDTLSGFAALTWGGYPVKADVFEYYEMKEHFCTFREETNVSLSVQVRLLEALSLCKDHPRYQKWVDKIVSVLKRHDDNGSFWWDKWHASPYYVNSTALIALQGIDNTLVQSRYKWVIRTQNDDGGWGYLGQSTAEETAYCLEALLTWDREVAKVDPNVLRTAAQYLRAHLNDVPYTPLWIGKTLYTPPGPVKAAMLSALYIYSMYRERTWQLKSPNR